MNESPPTLKQRRRKWTELLGDAEWFIGQARIEAKRGNYAKSRSDTIMACFLLDDACQRDTETPE